MNDLWREFAKHERQLTAPPHLEARVMAAVRTSRDTRPRRAPASMVAALCACAVLVIAAFWPASRDTTEQHPLAARPMPVTALPQAVTAHRRERHRDRPAAVRIHPDLIAQYDDLATVLVMFDVAPSLMSEPVQIVRLRVRRDALQALGLAVLEPDAGGTVDLDVLVGEDGLPRDIRTIRNPQEER